MKGFIIGYYELVSSDSVVYMIIYYSVPNMFSYIFPQPTITTTNIETLLVATEKEEKITPPPEQIQDKVAFIFNNLAQVNLPQKVSA